MKHIKDIYPMVNEVRQRIIETMRERHIALVQFCPANEEEYLQEHEGEDDVQDYGDFRDSNCPYVIFFDKHGCGGDYCVHSVSFIDGEHPHFKMECEGEYDWETFYDDDVVWLTMLNVYECLESQLEIDEDDKKYVWVFTADQIADADVMDIITRVFETEQSALDCLYEFVHGDDGELAYAEKRGWKVEYDKPDHFRAYEEGYYCQNHTEATVEMIEVKH